VGPAADLRGQTLRDDNSSQEDSFMAVTPIDTDQIVITASRAPEQESKTPASVAIIDRERVARLGEPLIPALLRLTPSAAVTTLGPSGLLTEVRIRGADANHTLLFVDGIKIDDPASGDTPRFELLNADLASRIEIVRGPQSALWGSEAIGGVIAVNGVDDAPGYSASAEAGSFGFRRASASEAIGSDRASLAGAIGWQQATGIDSFSGQGDKDGYRNLSARLRGTAALGPSVKFGATAFLLTGRAQFDGYDPLTFEHTDTLDNSRNRLAAGRIWAQIGSSSSTWSGRVGGTLLGSSNRNLLGAEPVNRTRGSRRSLDAQVEKRFSTGPVAHRLIVAAEGERETFTARDVIYGGATDQDRSRSHNSLTAEWRASTSTLTGDVAVRRDLFNRFADTSSLRASLLAELGGGFALAGSYAEGIAQPTFFDLYGFFPSNFVGNALLEPESSRGFEGSLRFRHTSVQASLTAYRQRLHSEIVDVFDTVTFLSSTENREGTSRRSGIEAELGWQPLPALRLTANYSYLRATQPDGVADRQLYELRRPKHSGSLAADSATARWTYGASLAYVGTHLDREEVGPFAVVGLGAYWLAGARLAYAVRPGIELFARASNLFDARYQDSAGYRTEGRGLYAGIRLAGRRSSP
jgi:vitamin B12 transporter